MGKRNKKVENKTETREFSAEELQIMAEIKRLRLCVLIHSIIYYRLNTSIISDFQYDKFAKKLKALQDQYPKLSMSVKEYYKDFDGWDGCSGFKLPLGDIWAFNKAQWLLKEFKK